MVLEVFGVSEGGMVENAVVGDGGADKVDHQSENPVHGLSGMLLMLFGWVSPCYYVQCHSLPVYIVPLPLTHVGIS